MATAPNRPGQHDPNAPHRSRRCPHIPGYARRRPPALRRGNGEASRWPDRTRYPRSDAARAGQPRGPGELAPAPRARTTPRGLSPQSPQQRPACRSTAQPGNCRRHRKRPHRRKQRNRRQLGLPPQSAPQPKLKPQPKQRPSLDPHPHQGCRARYRPIAPATHIAPKGTRSEPSRPRARERGLGFPKRREPPRPSMDKRRKKPLDQG